MLAANFMLTRMMKLNAIKRICFMVLTYCTYTTLLFTLMMEQYIVAYFWLVFCMYLISENRRPERIALWGAGGTLLTSMVLLPFMSQKSPIKNFKEWFLDMVKYGLEFVALMLAFCRFDVIFNLKAQIFSFTSFTGQTVATSNKLFQYTAFIHNCFAAPKAGTVSVKDFSVSGESTFISWQLNPVSHLDIIGILIFLLVIISAILNRDKISSRFAAGWVGFSIVILFLLGWGTRENGLILYSLYFGWAFLVLLFQLVERIQDKLNVTFLLPVISIGSAAVLTSVNLPSIREMIDFAIAYFPV
ncbi:MAG: hypothetical protein HFH73_14200 [Lachnospiraceae bacterium]|nr:hypothetical protein [Lachnospiraceae bacterium]